MCNIIFFVIMVNVEVQTDWVTGPGVLGPVNSWGAAFYLSDSITYNIQGQISPVATDVNYTAWTKHIIDQDANILVCINSITYGDFDNDGDQDLVGAKGGANIIVFYENQGTTFVQGSSFSAPGGADAFISVNYINNDQMIDVVVSGSTGLTWFENLGSFNFTPHTMPTTNYGFVETGDIDNDGDIDIANGGQGTSGPIYIWKNDGFGNFTNTQTISQNKWRLRFDDLDGDGDLDLINAHCPSGTYIYFNDGTGNFAQASFLLSTGVDAMWSRDFDNDGDQDVLTGDFPSGSNYIRWWENDGTGINYTPHFVYNGTTWLYGDGAFVEDMDMDGKADAVSGYTRLAWFRQITLNNFIEYVIDANPLGTHWIYPLYRGKCFIGVDVLVSTSGYFYWYENNMINQFTDSSWLKSSVLNSNCDASWLWFGYDVCCPYDSAISFQFRSGKDSTDITGKPWSSPVFLLGLGAFVDSVALAPFTTVGDTLFQYKVNLLGSQDAPIVYEVWVKWNCSSGVEEVGQGFSLANIEVRGNKVYYSLPRELDISLSLYDISGRLIKPLEKGRKSTGEYVADIPSLPTGIYFINLSSDQGRLTKKFIILH